MVINKYEFFEMIREELDNEQVKSAWRRGVRHYAYEFVDSMVEAVRDGYTNIDDLQSPRMIEKILLNGADNWDMYSWGGCSLIYNSDISERLCTPSELKKTRNGERNPNSQEDWLDTQARALFQACNMVKRVTRHVFEKCQEREQDNISASFIDAIRRDGTASSAG